MIWHRYNTYVCHCLSTDYAHKYPDITWYDLPLCLPQSTSARPITTCESSKGHDLLPGWRLGQPHIPRWPRAADRSFGFPGPARAPPTRSCSSSPGMRPASFVNRNNQHEYSISMHIHLNMYIYIYICVYIYIYICMYICIDIYIYITSGHTVFRSKSEIGPSTLTSTCLCRFYVCIYIFIFIFISIYISRYRYLDTIKYIYTYIHTYIHTYIIPVCCNMLHMLLDLCILLHTWTR